MTRPQVLLVALVEPQRAGALDPPCTRRISPSRGSLRCVRSQKAVAEALADRYEIEVSRGGSSVRIAVLIDGTIDIVEESLRRAALWDEVKDRLKESAFSLSGGQQRLCIACALAVRPQVLLMAEPFSALDPKATEKIEATTRELAEELTVVIVTHNLQQAGRVSDHVAVFLAGGELAEFGSTKTVFEDPAGPRVQDYLAGRFGWSIGFTPRLRLGVLEHPARVRRC